MSHGFSASGWFRGSAAFHGHWMEWPMSSEEKLPAPREGRSANKDILPLLKGWDYEPGTINVRKINGADGQPKLQMRLDLGLLQMELDGRPDGTRPHGCDSLLDYFEKLLREQIGRAA